ncbi:hypothetical protein CMV_018836 [Castanea mollissima]|uniref:Uncharacterized protein n=1 Tax=Castanea mollissima TaxID=60419 RepID=A0A8J4VC68_9ROSI|nr:hypothetical protein CMV_018836 [Castanea mollissima]
MLWNWRCRSYCLQSVQSVNAIIAAGYLVTFMHRIANTIIAAQSSLIISHRQLQNGKGVWLDVYSEDRFKGMSLGESSGVLRYLWSLWIHDWVTLLLIGHVVLEFLVNAATVCP